VNSLVQKVQLRILNAKERRTAHQDLYGVIKNDPETANLEDGDLWHGISKLPSSTAVEARKFITNNSSVHPGFAMAVVGILQNYFDANRRITTVMRNFDHAVDLGWLYAPAAFRIILESIDEAHDYPHETDGMEFTAEQESALLVLGDSQWDKSGTYGTSNTRRLYDCGNAVVSVVLERPHEIDAIIDVARKTDISHSAHLISILDGEITMVLGEGAL
jgi:hypothetical protein